MHAPAYTRIVLTGFMGAGKSTVGRFLAPMLGWQFLDSDALIAKEAGRSVAEIFATHGEPYFRQLEARIIHEALVHPRTVLALGGGALEHEETRGVLHCSPQTLIAFLSAPLDVLLDRCLAEEGGATRPVLTDREGLESRFTRRLAWYEESATLTLSTLERSPQALAESIAAHLATLS